MSLILILLFFILSFFGIPLAISLGLSSILTVYIYGLPLTIITRLMYTSMNSFILVAVPLFILAGNVMQGGGVSDQIFGAANSWMGRFRGGIGHVNVIASFIFGGISGSSVADVATLGPMEIKEMTKQNYPKAFATSLTMVTSTLSSVVPPSILMIIASVAGNQSVSKCLAGGFGPALLLAISFMIINYIFSIKHNCGIIVQNSFKEICTIFIHALPALLSPVIILIGMFSGIVTPTESAGLAVIYTLIVSKFFYKQMKWKDFPKMIIDSGIMAGTILLIAMTASIATYIFSVDHLPSKVSSLLLQLTQNPKLIMLIIGFIFIIIGMFLDITAAILLLTPVFMPTALAVGVEPIHFIVFMVTALSIGLTTPPVGVCIYTASLVSKISIEKIVVESLPFYFVMFVFICIHAVTPSISTFFAYLLT